MRHRAPGQPGTRVAAFKGSAQESYARTRGWDTVGAQTDVQLSQPDLEAFAKLYGLLDLSSDWAMYARVYAVFIGGFLLARDPRLFGRIDLHCNPLAGQPVAHTHPLEGEVILHRLARRRQRQGKA